MLASVFIGIHFSHKNISTAHLIINIVITTPPLLPKSTMSLPVIKIEKEMKEKKLSKTKIDVGSLVKVKDGETEKNKREGKTRRIWTEVAGCFQDVTGNKNLLVQFEDGQKREMSYCSLSYVCSKYEVGQEVDEPISDLPQK